MNYFEHDQKNDYKKIFLLLLYFLTTISGGRGKMVFPVC